MIVDSSALIAVILGEPEEEVLAKAMLRHGAPAMSAANWLEAAMVIDSRRLPEGRIRLDDAVAWLRIALLPVTPEIASEARRAHQRYGRGQHPAKLNFGDCLAYATAASFGRPLLFKGEDFIQTDITPALPGLIDPKD